MELRLEVAWPFEGRPESAGSPAGAIWLLNDAVLVNLDGTSLPSWVYEQNDVWTIEEQLIEVLERDGIGELDGNEVGPSETVLYLYGPDADALHAVIKPVLLANIRSARMPR